MCSQLLRVVALSLATLLGGAFQASALTINFDENGNCSGDCGGYYTTVDPSGNSGLTVLIYHLLQIVDPGSVNILDPNGDVSDSLYFFTPTQSRTSDMAFYSYDNDGWLADVGAIATLFPNPDVTAQEDADGNFTYIANANTYNGFSGLSETPIPAALPLFASGLGALGLLGWRRKRKNAAAMAA
jgi:hypothetical protein